MIKKLVSKLLFASAALWIVSGTASAAVLSCSSTDPANPYDISGRVSGAADCLILAPLNGNQNDNDPELVNREGFFGIMDWVFDGKFEITENTEDSDLFDFSGNGESGTYSFIGTPSAYEDLMLVFKDGAGTNLVAYLLSMPIALGDGTYSTPFTKPPFPLTGGSDQKDISHISVYYVRGEGGSGGGGQVPEPGTTALLGLGMLGLGWVARRRKTKAF